MGRSYRFRLSDMMPNTWFYKLRDMGNKQARGGTSPALYSAARKSTRIPITPPRNFPSPSPPPPTPSSSLDKQHSTSLRPGRASYYIPSGEQDRLLCSPAHQLAKFVVVDPPRKSKKKSRMIPKPLPPPAQETKHAVTTSGLGPGCGCRDTLESVWAAETDVSPPEFLEPGMDNPMRIYEDEGTGGYYYTGKQCPNKVVAVSKYSVKSRRDTEFAIDVEGNIHSPSTTTTTTSTTTSSTTTTTTTSTTNALDAEAGDVVDLRPILTKPAAQKERTSISDLESPVKLLLKNQSNQKKGSGPRSKKTSPSSSPLGVSLRTRVNSPRFAAASRKVSGLDSRKASGLGRQRRSSAGTVASSTTPKKGGGRLSGSLAVVKSSSDPGKDFRESMLEMIEENKLWASKDLEELLACYLSLNSSEYHDVIIKVFQQIWFDITNLNNSRQDKRD